MKFVPVEKDSIFERTYDHFDFDLAIELIKNANECWVMITDIKISTQPHAPETLSFKVKGKLSDVKRLNEFVKNESNAQK